MLKKASALILSGLLITAVFLLGLMFIQDGSTVSAHSVYLDQNLDLSLDGGANPVNVMNGELLKPGDQGKSFIVLRNSGKILGTIDILFSSVKNTGASGGSEFEDGVGNLGDALEFALWIDNDDNGEFDCNRDTCLRNDGGLDNAKLKWDTVNEYSEMNWDSVIMEFNPGDFRKFYIDWRLPSSTGNEVQGDSLSFSIDFTLQQSY